MLTLLANENFDNHVVRGVRLRGPAVILVRVKTWASAGPTTQRFWNGLRRTAAYC